MIQPGKTAREEWSYCETCAKDRRFIVVLASWCGEERTCMWCGERWFNGSRKIRPFRPGWRETNVIDAMNDLEKYGRLE